MAHHLYGGGLMIEEQCSEGLDQARERFVRQWGAMGSSWGINRTMAQIHALLLVSPRPLDTNAVMEALQISRGNANSNLRDLVGWGLIHNHYLPGDRKEYFEAEKDVWKMFCAISRERKRREIEPALLVLSECAQVAANEPGEEAEAFRRLVKELTDFISLADAVMEKVSRSERSRVVPLVIKALGGR